MSAEFSVNSQSAGDNMEQMQNSQVLSCHFLMKCKDRKRSILQHCYGIKNRRQNLGFC